MEFLLSLTPYALSCGMLLLAFFGLRKDWEQYKSSKLKMGALAVLCAVAILTFINQYHEDNEKAKDIRKSAEQGQNLQGQVKAANDAQRDNTTLFLKSFDNLNQKLGDLQTQVKTDALQKKLTSVQGELEATRRALLPGPKAVLAFTFWPFYNTPQSLTLANQARFSTNDDDGSHHVEFSVVNLTDVDAMDGDITLVICDLCKFSKEPPGFSKLNGQSDNERTQSFQRILARTHLAEMTADIIAPKNQNFQVGIAYRCHTCIVSSQVNFGTVLISGSITNQLPKTRLPAR